MNDPVHSCYNIFLVSLFLLFSFCSYYFEFVTYLLDLLVLTSISVVFNKNLSQEAMLLNAHTLYTDTQKHRHIYADSYTHTYTHTLIHTYKMMQTFQPFRPQGRRVCSLGLTTLPMLVITFFSLSIPSFSHCVHTILYLLVLTYVLVMYLCCFQINLSQEAILHNALFCIRFWFAGFVGSHLSRCLCYNSQSTYAHAYTEASRYK